MTAFRTALAWLLVAALALASPLAVAAHGSSHMAESGAQYRVGHSHADLYHADRHGEDGEDDEENKRHPVQPYHDQSVADHSHQAGGLVRDQTIERPSVRRHWRLASDPEVGFNATFRLERPPRF